MNLKVLSLALAVTMLPTLADTCINVCDMQNPLSFQHCESQYSGSPQMIRACCLKGAVYCPPSSCPDYVDVSQLTAIYDVDAIVTDDVNQTCDCVVVTCVESNFATCSSCSP